MANFNFLAILIAAIVSLVIGFIWYNPKVFGNAWLKSIKHDPNDTNRPNMGLFIGLSFVLALPLGLILHFITIHQFGFTSLLGATNDLTKMEPELRGHVEYFFNNYSDDFRTFKHGAFHGFIMGLMFVTPIIAINSIYEKRSFKYIAISAGYWIVTLTIMGSIICGWVK
ncbi:MAG: DUF1761 domain-containing protein [Bacteroidia bacterium]|nr:DUF1761 domain-containing protein [Bacteroidia bacterium]